MCPIERALRIVVALLFLTILPASATVPPQLQVESTPHYRVEFEGPKQEARDLALCLEAAFESFGDFLQRSPKRKDEPFKVTVWANKASWDRGLNQRGIAAPPWAVGRWFREDDGAVYVQRNAIPYLTRSEALVAAFQQFHYHCRTKNRALLRSWFVVGLAEHLALHRWDGQRLQLGVVPLIATHDPPGRALDSFDTSVTGLQRLTDEALREPTSAWAWVSYLLSGKEPKHSRRFRKLALGTRGSMLTGNDFADSLGDPVELALSVQLWLESVQSPWKAVAGEWEDLDGETIEGASRGLAAVARLDRPASRLRIEIEPREKSVPGIVLGWNGTRNHVAVVLLEDRIRALSVKDGQRQPGWDEAIEPSRAHVVIATSGQDGYWIEVDGGPSNWVDTGEGSLGLVVRAGSARFRGIEWE